MILYTANGNKLIWAGILFYRAKADHLVGEYLQDVYHMHQQMIKRPIVSLELEEIPPHPPKSMQV